MLFHQSGASVAGKQRLDLCATSGANSGRIALAKKWLLKTLKRRKREGVAEEKEN